MAFIPTNLLPLIWALTLIWSKRLYLRNSSTSLFVVCCLVAKSCPTLATPWTVARQALLSVGFSRQEYWSGLPFPSPGVLPDPGMEPGSSALQTYSLLPSHWGSLHLRYWLKVYFCFLASLEDLSQCSLGLCPCYWAPDLASDLDTSPVHPHWDRRSETALTTAQTILVQLLLVFIFITQKSIKVSSIHVCRVKSCRHTQRKTEQKVTYCFCVVGAGEGGCGEVGVRAWCGAVVGRLRLSLLTL